MLCVVIPLSALGLYVHQGRPDLPAQPFAERRIERPGPPSEVMTALANLMRHLETNPGDLQGWLLLGQVYDRMGRFEDSAEAYRKAVGVSSGNAEVASSFGEALFKAAEGRVSGEAEKVFEAALAANPDDPRARYYLALARAQVGDWRGALDRWAELVRRSPADAPWLPVVRQRIGEAAAQLNLDPATVTPEPRAVAAAPEAASPPATGSGAGPTREQMDQAAALTPEQRQGMVRGMVEGLAARLRENPGDAQGWLRLARSYRVLGEAEQARAALDSARQAAPEDPEVLSAYAEALIDAAPEDPSQGGPLPAEAAAALASVLQKRPDDPQALYYLGQEAARTADAARARELWQRLLRQLDPASPAHAELNGRIAALKGG